MDQVPNRISNLVNNYYMNLDFFGSLSTTFSLTVKKLLLQYFPTQ